MFLVGGYEGEDYDVYEGYVADMGVLGFKGYRLNKKKILVLLLGIIMFL